MKRRFGLGGLALCCILWLVQGAGAGDRIDDPLHPPGLPERPPPAVRVSASAPDPERAPGTSRTFPSYQGWNVVVFPFTRVTATRGYPYQLLTLGPRGWQAVDPVNSPQKVDTSLAYVTWFDKPGRTVVRGLADPQEKVTLLHPGWNVLGVPSSGAVASTGITVTAAGGATRVPSEVADDSPVPGRAWLYSKGFSLKQGQRGSFDMRSPSGAPLQPGWVFAVFAWRDLELNWNLRPPRTPPHIDSVSSTTVSPGMVLDLRGRGFGTPGEGALTLAGAPVQPEDVLSWSPDAVRIRVPAAARSGLLIPFLNRFPGNRVALEVLKGPEGTLSSLYGQVRTSQGGPLAGASLQVDDGWDALSDAQGNFRLEGLPPGQHHVYVSRVGYKTGTGRVTLAPGEVRSLGVSLSPVGSAAPRPEQPVRFSVRAYPYDNPNGGPRFWARRIEVWEYGSQRRSWSRTWDSDPGWSYNELVCDGGLVGRDYCVRVYWRCGPREQSNLWTPELEQAGQVFTCYRP